VLNVTDSYPVELLFPIREGRTKRQLGKKNRDKGRWSIGVKLCWVVNTYGRVVGWSWLTMNRADQDFNPLFSLLDEVGVVFSDMGFRCAGGIPTNLKLCLKGTYNDQMMIETIWSMLTVVCHTKKLFHRLAAYLEAHLAYLAAMFNTLLTLFHQLHPDADPFQLSIAEFSL